MIDYCGHGDAYETLSALSSIATADDLFEVFPTSRDDASHLVFDDYSLGGIGGFDDLVYEESLDLPLLEEPSHEEAADTNEGGAGLPPLLLPGVDAELDRTMSIFHLLKAYGEATAENASAELARVILARLRQKASPVGTTMERLAHYLLLQESDPQAEFLTHESIKNFPIALQAIYEMTPYGRFAHFVANAVVHESVPRDAMSVHIVDFDVGEGVQWPPLLAALGPHRSVRITCMDVDDEHCFRLERTKERLLTFAQTMRLKLRVDRMRMEELLLEKKRMEVRGEWLVFNCMVGLPHMGRANRKVRSKLEEFMNVARQVIASNGRRGLLVCGGNVLGLDTRPYSDAHLLHSHALFESMEWHFPSQFSLARAAMECLFVGPACASFVGSEGDCEKRGSAVWTENCSR